MRVRVNNENDNYRFLYEWKPCGVFFRRYFKAENDEKTRQNAENKQTFDLQFAFDRIREKFKLWGKTCQNAKSKQTFDLTGKIEIEGKTRQNAKNKQTFF